MKKRLVAFLLVLIMVLGMLPVSAFAADDGVSPQALEPNETQTIKYQILYVGDEFNTGYSYGVSVNKTYTCQYSTGHSGFNHSILISEFRNVGVPALKGQLDSGYEFVGWAKEAKENPTIYDFNVAGTTATQTTYTIYLVAKKAVPPTVTYTLTYYPNTTDLVTNMPSPNPVTQKSSTSPVTFTVSSAIPAREGYNFLGWNGKPDATTPTVQPGNWVTTPATATNLYAVWEKNDSPVPDNPGGTKPDVANAQVKICVQCIEDPATHQPKNYGILPGAYVDGLLQVDGTYYYSITLNRAKYIEKFDQDSNKTHTDTEPNESIQFKWQWKNGKWELISDIAPVIKCQCEKQVEEKYTVTYTDGVDGKFFEDVVFSDLKSGVATPAFGKDPYHPGYTFAGWEPEVAETVTKTVTYVAKWTPVEPKAPTADELKNLEMAVQVKCVVDASQQHTAAYGLLGECDVDYFVFEPRQEGDDWLCDISYYPERYVAEFNTTFQNLKHVQNDEKIVPVTLIWAGGSWQIKTQGRVLVTEEYTVTYTDGVDGEEVFADQVYSDLRKDSTTPAFNGTPTRTGYTFAGWEPVVAATVTETVTYVAKWEAKKANVHLMIFKSGDLSKPIVDVPYAADKLAGDTIDLTKIDPSSYLDFDF